MVNFANVKANDSNPAASVGVQSWSRGDIFPAIIYRVEGDGERYWVLLYPGFGEMSFNSYDEAYDWAVEQAAPVPALDPEMAIYDRVRFPDAWVHIDALVSKTASVGEGACIAAFAKVEDYAKIGRGAIVRSYATVSLRAVIQDYALVGGGALICNGAVVGEQARIGACSRIGAMAVVGGGAYVRTDAFVNAGAHILVGDTV